MRPVYVPRNLDELWLVLSKHPGAALYAGGTDLLVRIRSGLADPPALICLERVHELRGVQDHGGRVFIGACTTHSGLMGDHLIRSEFPVLARALEFLGSPLIRNMGTIGGNVVTASPAGDTLPPLAVLGAEVELRGEGGSRVVPIHRFIRGPGETDLAPGEILAGIWLRKGSGFNLHHYEKVGRRRAMAIAVVSLAALLKISKGGMVEEARFAWGSVGPTVMTSREAEAALTGRAISLQALEEVAVLAREAIQPIDDVRASRGYREAVAGNLVLRLLERVQMTAGSSNPEGAVP